MDKKEERENWGENEVVLVEKWEWKISFIGKRRGERKN